MTDLSIDDQKECVRASLRSFIKAVSPRLAVLVWVADDDKVRATGGPASVDDLEMLKALLLAAAQMCDRPADEVHHDSPTRLS